MVWQYTLDSEKKETERKLMEHCSETSFKIKSQQKDSTKDHNSKIFLQAILSQF